MEDDPLDTGIDLNMNFNGIKYGCICLSIAVVLLIIVFILKGCI
jgi:hypothetical protein